MPADGGDREGDQARERHVSVRRCGARTARACCSSASATRNDGRDDSDWYFVPADGGAISPTGAVERLQGGRSRARPRSRCDASGVLFADGDFDSTNIYRMPFDATFQKVVRRSSSGDRRRGFQLLADGLAGWPPDCLRGRK